MPDTGYKNPVTVESTGSWTNCTVANLNSSNNVRAALSWANSPSSFVLSDFDFQLPDNIDILGIEVLIERRTSNGSYAVRLDAELSYNNGSNWTTKKNGSNYSSTTDGNQIHGGAADLWGRSWSKSEFAVGTFQLRVTGNAIGTFGDSQVDLVQVKVYYQNQDIAPVPTLNTTDNTEFHDDTPTLEATADDEGDSDLVYEFQIDTTNTFNSQAGSPLLAKVSSSDSGFLNTVNGGDTSPFNNNEKVSFTVQAGDALPVGTYYWRVRAKDVSGTNAFGSWSETRKFHVYAVDKEASKVSIGTIPTNSAHPYSSGALALLASEIADIDANDADRLALAGTDTLYPLLLLKRKLTAGAGFILDFDGQVDLEAALGTISFDAASNSGNYNNGTPWQWNHTVASGSDRVLVVVLQIWTGGGTPATATSVTYNGVAMTLAKRQSGTDRSVEIWVLANPDTGTHQISATLSANSYGSGGAVSYQGVDQSTPVNTTGGGAGTSQNSSQSITTSVNGCEIISGVAGSQSTYSPGNSETERGEGSSTGIVRQFQTYSQTTAGSRTVTHNNAYITTQYHVQALIALQPASVDPSIKIDLWNFDTSSWDNVYEQTSPTEDTDFTTQLDKTTGYEDYVDGSGWIIARVYAEYFGVQLSVDQFTIEPAGIDDNSERSAKITGKTTANSERPAKVTGKTTSSSERSAKIIGQDTASSERPAKVTGQDSANSERGGRLTGTSSVDIDSERAAKVAGTETDNSERAAKLSGLEGSDSERSAKLLGTATTNAERATKITGKETSNSERPAKLTGTATANAERGAKLTGAIPDERAAKIYAGYTFTINDTFDTTDNKDTGQTTAKWDGDGKVTLG